MDAQAQMMRISSYRIHQSLVEKPLKIEDYWPLRSDAEKETEVITIDAEFLEEVKRAHGIN